MCFQQISSHCNLWGLTIKNLVHTRLKLFVGITVCFQGMHVLLCDKNKTVCVLQLQFPCEKRHILRTQDTAPHFP